MAKDIYADGPAGGPARLIDPRLTITSVMLTIMNYPLRWFSSWPVWIALAAVLLSITGLREYRVRTR